MNQRATLVTGAILGALGVALGAFGAHALKAMLEAGGRTDTFELAVRYQFYHAFALLAVGVIQQIINSRLIRLSSWCFLSGTLLFSGSLYLLCFTQNTSFALVTPFGGILLLAGWILLTLGILKGKK
jgi:uncharacterized membrane protein YgdD (TMEM256/DUF423 family)